MKRIGVIVVSALLTTPALAQFEQPSIAVVRPGAGYLVADSRSIIPLQIVIVGQEGGPKLKRARVTASEGRVYDVRTIGPDRVQFRYQPPAKRSAVDEILDVSLTMSNGNRIAEAFTLLIPPARTPELELSASPTSINVARPSSVGIAATAKAEDIERLEIVVDRGQLAPSSLEGGDRSKRRTTTLELPQLPPDAPSHLIVLAAASSASGYAVRATGVSVLAPVRVSVEIDAGHELVVEGAEIEQEPVTAPADGRTVMEDVIVRYGKRVRAFEDDGDERRELSVVIPNGLVSLGTVMALPGQNVADGGTGPTLIVAVPPSPFGGKPFWPDLDVEGAKLVEIQNLAPTVRILVLERPTEAKVVRVLLDEESIGEIEFGAALGQFMKGQAVDARSGERAAVELRVRDASGNPADFPSPKARIEGGTVIDVTRTGIGIYRASVPANAPGATGATVEVYAELPPPPKVAGEALELVSVATNVQLSGSGPAISTGPPNEKKKTIRPRRKKSLPPKFGIAGAAVAGRSFEGLLMFGGGVMVELRLPFLAHRFAVRAGLEFMYASASGRVAVGDAQIESNTAVAGVLVPIDFGFALLSTPSFELLARAGVAIRIEQGAVTVGNDSAGGGSRVGLGARAGVEADITVGSGALFIGAGISGLGASANGFSTTGGTKIDGNLTAIRVEVGYRAWF